MDDAKTVLTPFAVPSDRLWFDPAVIGQNLIVNPSDVAVDPAAVTPLVPANPYRWALGVMLAPGSGVGARASPFADMDGGCGYILSADRLEWFVLTTYGPLVSLPWFAFGGAGSVARVVEVIRVVRSQTSVHPRRSDGKA